jgi:hypothetical protein
MELLVYKPVVPGRRAPDNHVQSLEELFGTKISRKMRMSLRAHL